MHISGALELEDITLPAGHILNTLRQGALKAYRVYLTAAVGETGHHYIFMRSQNAPF
jgi:hypothetical protein